QNTSIQTDPLTRNTYTYVNGDPVNLTDPTGHFSLPFPAIQNAVNWARGFAALKSVAARTAGIGAPTTGTADIKNSGGIFGTIGDAISPVFHGVVNFHKQLAIVAAEGAVDIVKGAVTLAKKVAPCVAVAVAAGPINAVCAKT